MDRNKIKIIHIGLDSNNPREAPSIEQLKSLGIRYIRVENEPYNLPAPTHNIFKGWVDFYKGAEKPNDTPGLTDRHYGCWLAHKQATALGFSDPQHFLICEGDCKILDIDLFKHRLSEAIDTLDNNPQYHLVRFEPPDSGVSTTFGTQVNFNIFECDQIITTHCYLVNKNSKDFLTNLYEEEGWTTPDDWLNFTFKDRNIPFLAFKEKLTTQYDGFSEIDKIHKSY